MLGRGYFLLVDQIAAARTDDELAHLSTRVATIAMHPFEHRALERRLRVAETALLELEGL